MGTSLITPIATCQHEKPSTVDGEDSEEEPLTARGSKNKRAIPRKPVDFVGQGLLPAGWRLSDEPVPHGFGLLGGCACVVVPDEHAEGATNSTNEHAEGATNERDERDEREDDANKTSTGMTPINFDRAGLVAPSRVLLALPDWAVDVARAQWLSRLPEGDDWKMLLKLWRVTVMESLELVVMEFAQPPADSQNLAARPKESPLSEEEAQRLYHDLLRLILCLPTLRLWGLLRPELIHLDGQQRLASLIPLGQLLSFEGARAAIRAAPGVAPELATALANEDRTFADDRSRSLEADAYGVVALVVASLGGAEGSVQLSASACDLLESAFQRDPRARLTAGKAILHPWLAMNEPPELLSSPRVSACTPRRGSKACRVGALGGRI